MKHPYHTFQSPNYLLRVVLLTALILYVIVYVSANGGVQMPNTTQASGSEE